MDNRIIIPGEVDNSTSERTEKIKKGVEKETLSTFLNIRQTIKNCGRYVLEGTKNAVGVGIIILGVSGSIYEVLSAKLEVDNSTHHNEVEMQAEEVIKRIEAEAPHLKESEELKKFQKLISKHNRVLPSNNPIIDLISIEDLDIGERIELTPIQINVLKYGRISVASILTLILLGVLGNLLKVLIKLRSNVELRDIFFENAPTGLIIMDENGVIQDVNNAGIEVFGYENKGNLIGENISILLPHEIRERHSLYVEKYGHHHLDTNKIMGKSRTIRGFKKNGTDFPMHIHLKRFTTPENKTQYIATVEDLTDKENIERQKEENLKLLEEVSKAKDKILQALTHELKTPLNPIIGFLENVISILKSGINDPLLVLDQLGHAHSAAITLDELLSDILLLASLIAQREENQELEVTSIHDILNTLERELEVRKEVNSSINYNVVSSGSTESCFMSNPTIIKAIKHLVFNAIKFSECKIGIHQVGINISVNYFEDESALFIEISDNGIGISTSDLEKLRLNLQKREPFIKLDGDLNRKTEGLGIGLPLVYQIVKEHKGELYIESSEGIGTTITLKLPKVDPYQIIREMMREKAS